MTGHPTAVTLERASATRSFSDRPGRDAADLGATVFAQDFARDFAVDPPNVAIFGWTRSQLSSLVATAARADWQAGPKALRYELVQFPEQVPATALEAPRARRAAARGGQVRLRECTLFVDSAGDGVPAGGPGTNVTCPVAFGSFCDLSSDRPFTCMSQQEPQPAGGCPRFVCCGPGGCSGGV